MFPIKRLCYCVSLLLVASYTASAANWFVRPNGGTYGSENGTDWSNAYDGFSGISWASVGCGDTIWIAGGTYTQSLVPQKKCTSGNELTIARARSDASAATSATGWQAGFASTITQTASIDFNGDYDYIILSGRTTASGGSHGWLVDFTATTGGCAICFWANSSDFNKAEYMDLQGPGPIDYTESGRGIDVSPASGSVTGNSFSHIKIWDFETCALNVSSTNTLWEYLDISDCQANNWVDFHPNGLIIWAADTGIFRYSTIHSGPRGLSAGEGLFFEQSGDCDNWQIYGNVFYDLTGEGKKALEVTASCANMLIYNNTFANCDACMYITVTCGTGTETKNNLFYSGGSSNCGTMANNLTASTSAVFTDYANKNYHIVDTITTGYPRDGGATLTTDGFINVDASGVTRGADGTWDIGAYEYDAGGAPAQVNVQHTGRISVSGRVQ